jgi:hypothetical protein
MRIEVIRAAATAALLGVCTTAGAEIRYRLVPLEDLGADAFGRIHMAANSVNDLGVVTGGVVKYTSGTYEGSFGATWGADGAVSAFSSPWTDSTGMGDPACVGINDSGVVIGFATKYEAGVSKGYHPVRWDAAGHPTELGGLGVSKTGYDDAFAYGIGDSGVVAGSGLTYLPDTSGRRGIRWEAGSTMATMLEPLSTDTDGAGYSAGWGVNVDGTVVGQSSVYDSQGFPSGRRAVKWDAGSTTAVLLDAPASGNVTADIAYAISDSGYIVGAGSDMTAYGSDRAIRWDANGVPTVLSWVLPNGQQVADVRPWDVNDAGVVVGMAGALGVGSDALLWEPDGSILDLNTLIDPTSGWVLTEARSINNAGWITGVGRLASERVDVPAGHGFLLIPVPEPACFGMVAAGAAVGLFGRRRRA